MPEHGRGSNCQYHGHNKPYENASTAAFGSQGLEKANVFQAGYQYSVLDKALKEDVGLEVSFAQLVFGLQSYSIYIFYTR